MTYSKSYEQMLDRGGWLFVNWCLAFQLCDEFLIFPTKGIKSWCVLLDKDTKCLLTDPGVYCCVLYGRARKWVRAGTVIHSGIANMQYVIQYSGHIFTQPAMLLVLKKKKKIADNSKLSSSFLPDKSVSLTNMEALSPSGPGPGILWSGGKTFHSNLVE